MSADADKDGQKENELRFSLLYFRHRKLSATVQEKHLKQSMPILSVGTVTVKTTG